MTGMACSCSRATTQKHHRTTGHGPATDQAWLNHGSVVAKPRPELPTSCAGNKRAGFGVGNGWLILKMRRPWRSSVPWSQMLRRALEAYILYKGIAMIYDALQRISWGRARPCIIIIHSLS